MDRHSFPITLAFLLIFCKTCSGSINSPYSVSSEACHMSDKIVGDSNSLFATSISTESNNTLKVKYNLAMKRASESYLAYAYDDCVENVELRTGNISLVSEILHYVTAVIWVGSCKGYCLNYNKKTFNTSKQTYRDYRDGTRVSLDSVFSIVQFTKLTSNVSTELDNMTVSHTFQFVDATTVNHTMRVEATSDKTKWNETHSLLQMHELPLVCKAGLRVLKQYGEWNERCRDQMALLSLKMVALTPAAEKTTEEMEALTTKAEKTTEEMEAPAPSEEEMGQDKSTVQSPAFIVAIVLIVAIVFSVMLYYRSSLLKWWRDCDGYSGNLPQSEVMLDQSSS